GGAVVGPSRDTSAASSADQSMSAGLLVSAPGSGELSDAVRAIASAVPGVTATTAFYSGRFEFQDSLARLTAVSTGNLAVTVILRMTAGTPAALSRGELLIDSTTARSKHLSVGGTVRARFALTGPALLRIRGVH